MNPNAPAFVPICLYKVVLAAYAYCKEVINTAQDFTEVRDVIPDDSERRAELERSLTWFGSREKCEFGKIGPEDIEYMAKRIIDHWVETGMPCAIVVPTARYSGFKSSHSVVRSVLRAMEQARPGSSELCVRLLMLQLNEGCRKHDFTKPYDDVTALQLAHMWWIDGVRTVFYVDDYITTGRQFCDHVWASVRGCGCGRAFRVRGLFAVDNRDTRAGREPLRGWWDDAGLELAVEASRGCPEGVPYRAFYHKIHDSCQAFCSRLGLPQPTYKDVCNKRVAELEAQLLNLHSMCAAP